MVMPLWDDNPFVKPTKPWVTWGLIALNIIVFMVQAGYGDAEDSIVAAYALTPYALFHPTSFFGMIPTDFTLITYTFLHASFMHIFGNMIFLFVFGDDVEEALGPLRFIVFYFVCGIAGGLLFAAFGAQSMVPLIGASGAVSGVIVAYLMLRPCAKIKVLFIYFVFNLDAYWVIGTWAVLQLVQFASQADDDVAYLAHIGGVLAGAVLLPLMRRPGVELFECIERRDEPFDDQSLTDSTNFPSAPREPTIR